ncbi:MAG TPA: Dabb family protein [Saprospiraceae bacterium]|nr:Dabb family protein [Saprospiraceae bacterium]HPI05425.1 Dabb family protein [Saprospiraceae bacterium]
MFIHHVYFWLKSGADRSELIAGLQKLTSIKSIGQWHIGTPAATNRPVIDSSYSVSWMLQFDSPEDEAFYQDHPDHHRFVAECGHLWERVVVYDSVSV